MVKDVCPACRKNEIEIPDEWLNDKKNPIPICEECYFTKVHGASNRGSSLVLRLDGVPKSQVESLILAIFRAYGFDHDKTCKFYDEGLREYKPWGDGLHVEGTPLKPDKFYEALKAGGFSTPAGTLDWQGLMFHDHYEFYMCPECMRVVPIYRGYVM